MRVKRLSTSLLFPARQPYEGESPISVAMAVLNEGRRPDVPEGSAPLPYIELMRLCWATDPGQRPTFARVLDRLSEAS